MLCRHESRQNAKAAASMLTGVLSIRIASPMCTVRGLKSSREKCQTRGLRSAPLAMKGHSVKSSGLLAVIVRANSGAATSHRRNDQTLWACWLDSVSQPARMDKSICSAIRSVLATDSMRSMRHAGYFWAKCAAEARNVYALRSPWSSIAARCPLPV